MGGVDKDVKVTKLELTVDGRMQNLIEVLDKMDTLVKSEYTAIRSLIRAAYGIGLHDALNHPDVLEKYQKLGYRLVRED